MNEYEIAGIENIARGVCVVDGKVLLCKPKGGSYAYLPGGHIEFGETGRQALEREIREEMGLESSAGDFLGVVESQFEQHGKPHAEINLIYRLTLKRSNAQTFKPSNAQTLKPSNSQTFPSLESWIEFEWHDVADLDNVNLLPAEMKEYVSR